MLLHNVSNLRQAVGIVVIDQTNKILIGKRKNSKSLWQVPQGGVNEGEETVSAAYRELYEEMGLPRESCGVLTALQPFSYSVPESLRPASWKDRYIGQSITFFLMKFDGQHEVNVNCTSEPEFTIARWVPFDQKTMSELKKLAPPFKKEMYERTLREFRNFLDLLNATQSTIFSGNFDSEKIGS